MPRLNPEVLIKNLEAIRAITKPNQTKRSGYDYREDPELFERNLYRENPANNARAKSTNETKTPHPRVERISWLPLYGEDNEAKRFGYTSARESWRTRHIRA
jgi:hypothetical protein